VALIRTSIASALLALLAAFMLFTAGCSRQGAIAYQGYVEGRFVYIASTESGRLERVSVARGETIDQGHPLFGLDTDPEASAARQAQQALRSSESRLADLETGKRPAEIEVTRAELMQALSEKKEADGILQIDKAQYRAGGIPQTDLINAQAAVDSSTAKVHEMEASLAVDAMPARGQQIRAQRNQVAADRAALAEAQWRLDQKEIASPRTGLVFDTLYREGEWVAAGNPVVQLLPPENLEVRFFVPEPVVGRLKTGTGIRIQCDGCAGVVPATITFISPQCEYTPPVIYSNENRSKLVFMVIAKPAVQKAIMLHPGQPVEVTIE
jgi:HlyD family secretion protein